MRKSIIIAISGIAVVFFGACKNTAKESTQTVQQEMEVIEPDPDYVPIVATEELIYDIPIMPVSERTVSKDETKSTVTTPKQKMTTKNLEKELAKSDIVPVKKIDTSFFCFKEDKLNTVKTVTSYQKHGEEMLKIVSDPSNPEVVDYIVFTDKKDNTDVYGVNVGLSGKEARHLRHDLKHFIRKGKVFLYTEDSNILYELDGVTSAGKTVTEQDVDNMHVASVIWKDKADKPHEKRK
jgi:hypothetical protein